MEPDMHLLLDRPRVATATVTLVTPRFHAEAAEQLLARLDPTTWDLHVTAGPDGTVTIVLAGPVTFRADADAHDAAGYLAAEVARHCGLSRLTVTGPVAVTLEPVDGHPTIDTPVVLHDRAHGLTAV